MGYIYKITNDINNKVYIGKTMDTIQHRWQEHCHDYLKRDEEKRPLYRAMKKYGIEHFHICQVEEVIDWEELSKQEIYWIAYYDSYHNGYNATIGGDGRPWISKDEILNILYLYDSTDFTVNQISKNTGHDFKTIKRIVSNFRDKPNWEARQEKFQQSQKKRILCEELNIEFESLSEAGEWVYKEKKAKTAHAGRVAISRCCSKGRPTAYGYHWKFI